MSNTDFENLKDLIYKHGFELGHRYFDSENKDLILRQELQRGIEDGIKARNESGKILENQKDTDDLE